MGMYYDSKLNLSQNVQKTIEGSVVDKICSAICDIQLTDADRRLISDALQPVLSDTLKEAITGLTGKKSAPTPQFQNRMDSIVNDKINKMGMNPVGY